MSVPAGLAAPEVERAVLGAVLIDPAWIRNVDLRDHHFADPRWRAAWRAAVELDAEGDPVDYQTVAAAMDPATLAEVGGVAGLSGLADFLPDSSRLDTYVDILRKAAQKRRLVTAAREVVETGADERSLGRLESALGDPATAGATGARCWSLAELAATPLELPPPVLPWIAWPSRASMLAGPEKGGKTTLTAAGVAPVTNGRPFLGSPTTQGHVLWVTEEHPNDAARRLLEFGAHPDRVTVMKWGANPVPEVRAAVEAADPTPVLVVIDTLAAIAELAGPESGSSAQWAKIMRPLVRIAHETGAAVLILHHANKAEGKYRDSTEIGAAVDVILEMKPTAGGALRSISVKGRFGTGKFSVSYDKDEHRFDLVSASGDGDGGPAGGGDVEAEVLEWVGANPGASLTAVRKGVQRRRPDVVRALHDLVEDGAVEDRGRHAREHRYHAVNGRGNRSALGPGRPNGESAPSEGVGPVGPESSGRGVSSSGADSAGGRPGPAPPRGGPTAPGADSGYRQLHLMPVSRGPLARVPEHDHIIKARQQAGEPPPKGGWPPASDEEEERAARECEEDQRRQEQMIQEEQRWLAERESPEASPPPLLDGGREPEF